MEADNIGESVCIVDSHHGIYAGQVLAERITQEQWYGSWAGIDQDDLNALLDGPNSGDDGYYWEALIAVEDNAVFTDRAGQVWHVLQDEDIFLVTYIA